MATKAAARKVGGKRKPARPRKRARSGEICFTVPAQIKSKIGPKFKSNVLDLKNKDGSLDTGELAKLLAKFRRSKVGFVILNAPFRLRPANSTA